MGYFLGFIGNIHNDECLIYIFTGNVENSTPIILIKNCWFQEEYEEAYFLHHDIISDTLLVIGYFDILRKPCSCSGCLRNLANKQQKGENKTMFIGLL